MLELNKIYCGNSLELFKELDDASVHLHIHSLRTRDLKIMEYARVLVQMIMWDGIYHSLMRYIGH